MLSHKFSMFNYYFGSILKIFDPPQVATYKNPSVSIVTPSGKNPAGLPSFLKSIRIRSLPKQIENNEKLAFRKHSVHQNCTISVTHKYFHLLVRNQILLHP